MSIWNTPPEIFSVEHLPIVKPQIFDITSKVKLLWMKDIPNDTVRLDLYFDAGIVKEKKSIPSLVHSLLFSGTAHYSSVEIHEQVDSLGGFLDTDISFETAIVSIYCLKEHLEPISHIVSDAINGLSFRENEVEDVLRSMEQRYKENQQKVRNVAQQQFRKSLFSSDENYSNVSDLSDFETAQIATMKLFWKEHYLNGLTRITLAGNIEADLVDALIDRFGKWAKDDSPVYGDGFGSSTNRFDFPVQGAVQTAIRMGKFLFPKQHEDFIGFQVLNTILGDYFGSRLMSNIREDKGYTYGIGSAMMELHNTSYFVIVTEVGKEVTEATISEIKNELLRLQTELVPEEELELVKNYLLGQFLKGADGPYAMLDLYNAVDQYGMTIDYYDRAIHETKTMTSERILTLAKKYLDWSDLLIITAG